jgi:single-strand DNA-binding protein
MQKIFVLGNLGNDPEMRYMPDGTAVTNFSVATNRRWTNQATGEGEEEVTWFRVSAWGRQAETCAEYLKKGRQVLVEGRMRPDPDTGSPRMFTRQDGTVGTAFEVHAFNVTFVSGGEPGSNGGGNSSGGSNAYAPGTPAATEEDEIPF